MPCTRRAYLVTALLLAGCASSEHGDLKEFVESDHGLRGRVEALSPAQVPETVVYQALDERDPFSPVRARPATDPTLTATQWVPPASREALEAYPLASLAMVGTMQRDGKRWALIRTPDNTVYRVTRGNRLGENFGAVAEVSETSLTLNEHIEDGSGLWTERVASLNLIEATSTN
jgi:type IV pilus assembly protein PilP